MKDDLKVIIEEMVDFFTGNISISSAREYRDRLDFILAYIVVNYESRYSSMETKLYTAQYNDYLSQKLAEKEKGEEGEDETDDDDNSFGGKFASNDINYEEIAVFVAPPLEVTALTLDITPLTDIDKKQQLPFDFITASQLILDSLSNQLGGFTEDSGPTVLNFFTEAMAQFYTPEEALEAFNSLFPLNADPISHQFEPCNFMELVIYRVDSGGFKKGDIVLTPVPAAQALGEGIFGVETFIFANGVKISFSLRGLNDPPVIDMTLTPTATDEDSGNLIVSFEDLLIGVSDAESDSLTVTGVSIVGDPMGAVTVNVTAETLVIDPTVYNTLGAGAVVPITVNYSVFDGSTTSILTKIININGNNDVTIVDQGITDQNALEAAPFSFLVPLNAFSDLDQGDTLIYTAQIQGGAPLSSIGLSMDTSGQFSGNLLPGTAGAIVIEVTANDGNGAMATTDFTINVVNRLEFDFNGPDPAGTQRDFASFDPFTEMITVLNISDTDSSSSVSLGDLLGTLDVTVVPDGGAVSRYRIELNDPSAGFVGAALFSNLPVTVGTVLIFDLAGTSVELTLGTGLDDDGTTSPKLVGNALMQTTNITMDDTLAASTSTTPKVLLGLAGNDLISGDVGDKTLSIQGPSAGRFQTVANTYSNKTETFADDAISTGPGTDKAVGDICNFAYNIIGGGTVSDPPGESPFGWDSRSTQNVQAITYNFGNDTLIGGSGLNTLVGDVDLLQWIINGGTARAEGFASDSIVGLIQANGDARSALNVSTHNFNFGNDTLTGGADGNILIGDVRNLTLSFAFETLGSGQTADATGASASSGGGTISGTALAQSTLTFDNNTFTFGNDTAEGGMSNDILIGDVQTLGWTIFGGDAKGIVPVSPGALVNATTQMNVTNSTLTFGNDTLDGKGGDDEIIGDVRTFTVALDTGAALSTLMAFTLAPTVSIGFDFNNNSFTFGVDTILAGSGNDVISGDVETKNLTLNGPGSTESQTLTNTYGTITEIYGNDNINTGSGNDQTVGDITTFNYTIVGGSVRSTPSLLATATSRSTLTVTNIMFTFGNDIILGISGLDTLIGDMDILNWNITGGTALSGGYSTGGLTAFSTPGNAGTTLNVTNHTFTYGEDTLQAGSDASTLIGDIRSFSMSIDFSVLASGGGAGLTAFAPNLDQLIFGASATSSSVVNFQNNIFTFGNDNVAGGDGMDLIIGDVQMLSLSVSMGDATAIDQNNGGATATAIVQVNATDNIFTFEGDILSGNGGNDEIIGDIETLTIALQNGTGSATGPQSLAISSYSFSSNTLTFGTDQITGGPGSDNLYGEYKTFTLTDDGVAVPDPVAFLRGAGNTVTFAQDKFIFDVSTNTGADTIFDMNADGVRDLLRFDTIPDVTLGDAFSDLRTITEIVNNGGAPRLNIYTDASMTILNGSIDFSNLTFSDQVLELSSQGAGFVEALLIPGSEINYAVPDPVGSVRNLTAFNPATDNIIAINVPDVDGSGGISMGDLALSLIVTTPLDGASTQRYRLELNNPSTGFVAALFFPMIAVTSGQIITFDLDTSDDGTDLSVDVKLGTNLDDTGASKLVGDALVDVTTIAMDDTSIPFVPFSTSPQILLGLEGNDVIAGDVGDRSITVEGADIDQQTTVTRTYSNKTFTYADDGLLAGPGNDKAVGDICNFTYTIIGGSTESTPPPLAPHGSNVDSRSTQIVQDITFNFGNDLIIGESGLDTLVGDIDVINWNINGGTAVASGYFSGGFGVLFSERGVAVSTLTVDNQDFNFGVDIIRGGTNSSTLVGDVRDLDLSLGFATIASGLGAGVTAYAQVQGNPSSATGSDAASSVSFQNNDLAFGNDTVEGGASSDIIIGDVKDLDWTIDGGDATATNPSSYNRSVTATTFVTSTDNTLTMGNDELDGKDGGDEIIGDIEVLSFSLNSGTGTLSGPGASVSTGYTFNTNTIIFGDDLIKGGPGDDDLYGEYKTFTLQDDGVFVFDPVTFLQTAGNTITFGRDTFIYDLNIDNGIDTIHDFTNATSGIFDKILIQNAPGSSIHDLGNAFTMPTFLQVELFDPTGTSVGIFDFSFLNAAARKAVFKVSLDTAMDGQDAEYTVLDGTNGPNRTLDNTHLTGNIGESELIFGHGGNDAIFGSSDGTIVAPSVADSQSTTFIQPDYLVGGTGNDTLYGDALGVNGLIASGDTIFGNEGVDTIYGDAQTFGLESITSTSPGGAVSLITVTSRGGDNTIAGGNGGDTIYGNAHTIFSDLFSIFSPNRAIAGSDNIKGGAGADTIYGDAHTTNFGTRMGADIIEGQGGADDLWGDVQNVTIPGTASPVYAQDTFVYDLTDTSANALGDDTIMDFNAGGVSDVLRFANLLDADGSMAIDQADLALLTEVVNDGTGDVKINITDGMSTTLGSITLNGISFVGGDDEIADYASIQTTIV